jgi:hypothetical protein
MDHLNGCARRLPEDFPALLLLFSQMERCAVQQAIPCMRQPRRLERNGSLRVLYAARIGHCRSCPLREHCQESGTTIKARRVSAVFWPVSSSSSVSGKSPPAPARLSPTSAPHTVLWGDWERCQIRRRWLKGVRTQTVTLTTGTAQMEEKAQTEGKTVLTRTQRAHWRLSRDERLARNARAVTAPPLEVTIHGLPAGFAQSFRFGLVTAA